MKKAIFTVILLAALLPGITLFARAADADRLYADSGAGDAFALLDDETRALLEKIGAEAAIPSSAAQISPVGVLTAAAGLLRDGFGGAVKQFTTLAGLTLLLALAARFLPQEDADGLLASLPLFFFAAAEIPIVTELAAGVLGAMETVSAFVRLLLPVLGVFTASSGAPASSAVLTAAGVGAAEAVSAAIDWFFVPLTGAYGAICVIGAADGMFAPDRGARLLKKVFTTLLGGASVLFSGVLALKGAAAKAGDSLAFRGAKFLAGGLVPVVGGALSDGMAAVAASLNAVNDTVGALGIAAVALILLPPILRVLLHRAVLWAASLAGELTGLPRVGGYLTGIAELLSMLDLLLLFDGFVFICALGFLIGAA